MTRAVNEAEKTMKPAFALALACFALQLFHPFSNGQQSQPLQLIRTVKLPGYSGDFDHFAIDRDLGRVLLAAEDHATLEIFDLKSGDHLRSVGGFDAPHSILVRPGSPTILVTDSGESMSKLFDRRDYTKKGTVKLVVGADSSIYDPAANVLYVVTGGKDVQMSTAKRRGSKPGYWRGAGKDHFQ
jgi:DNA-binding beta-propeller fold protein YncE